jgi:DNA-binding response OmpR family regulator
MSERDGVLVVDDDPDFRDLVKLVAQANGFTAYVASDCAKGLVVFDQVRESLRVVLLDYFMPGMKPIECARSFRERAGNEVRVILCTAAADAAERAREVGLSATLAKPFDLEALLRCLR